ncbi:histidine phosphatase family protein [Lactiplantibacillus carotarum]|uniref:histidine phosphatase family protein n=1 Tax=Lactiplantibacillus carotarum TaxID=2993456 RepID=UPI00298F3CD0|nr:histidine phosphatase family protein [Lactiplantibacillus carotarum]
MKSITLYLIRHGETYFNVFQAFQGWSDTPLTPTGIQQIQMGATQLSSLPITAVYASDMTRARQTASILCHHNTWPIKGVQVLSALREPFYGSFEGQKMAPIWQPIASQRGCLTYDDLVMQYSVDQAQDWLAHADPSRLTETSRDFWTRFTAGLTRIVTEQPDQAQVLLVSHSAVIRALVARYAPELLDPVTPENGKLTQLTLRQTDDEPLAIHVTAYNQVALVPK